MLCRFWGAGLIRVLVLRYKLAVTRRKEEEPTSTSIYNQNDPWTPTVAFADFIDNETITNEVSGVWDRGGHRGAEQELELLVLAVHCPCVAHGLSQDSSSSEEGV